MLENAVILIAGVLALVVHGRLPISSLPVTVFLLGLSGAVLGLVFTFSLTGPTLSRRREQALAKVLADVTAGKYRAAPDEVWLFKRCGWWTRALPAATCCGPPASTVRATSSPCRTRSPQPWWPG